MIHLFEAPQDIFEKIFTEKGEIIEKEYGEIETRYKKEGTSFFNYLANLISTYLKKDKIIWKGMKYPKLSQNNIQTIFKSLIDIIKESANKKNIFIIFGNKYLKPFRKLINSLEIDIPFVLFNFSENDNFENDYFDKFKLKKYISYIKDKYNPEIQDLNMHKIISYIWEKDCYYNERGNVSCSYSPANFLYKPSKGFIFFNILLIGESRAGKSSFINRMINKLVSYESSKYESATKEITYYEFNYSNISEEHDKNKLIQNGYGLIRILDTPGLVITKEFDPSLKIIEKIDKEIDNIHMIYFFLKAQSNIEQSIGTLKYIKQKNIERERNKLPKIPIFFIQNGKHLIPGGNGQILFQELKNILKKHNLLDLYDSFDDDKINNNPQKEINFLSDEEEEDNLNDYHNYIDGNIIQMYIPEGQNLNKLFQISKEYYFKNNKIILEGKLDDEFNKMKENTASLIKLYIKEKLENNHLSKNEKDLYARLYKESNEFVLKLQSEVSLLNNLDILKIKSDPIFYEILLVISYMFYIFIIPIFIFAFSITKYFNNLISKVALQFGFNEEDIKYYGLDKFVYSDEFLKEIKEEKDKEKSIKKIEEFFRKIIYYIGPIQCALKSRDAIFQIYEIFEKLSEKNDKDWNEFKVEKI